MCETLVWTAVPNPAPGPEESTRLCTGTPHTCLAGPRSAQFCAHEMLAMNMGQATSPAPSFTPLPLQHVLGEMEALASAPDPAAARTALAAQHPRLRALAARYGDVLAAAPREAGATSLSATLLNLTLTCVAAAAGAKMGSQPKRLPRWAGWLVCWGGRVGAGFVGWPLVSWLRFVGEQVCPHGVPCVPSACSAPCCAPIKAF